MSTVSLFLPFFRIYAEKSSDASLWLPPVSLCFVTTSVLRGTDASWDGPISAEQLHGWLWTAGRTVCPPRCALSNGFCQGLTLRASFCPEIVWLCCEKIGFIKIFSLVFPINMSHYTNIWNISLPHRNTMLSLVPPFDSVAAIYSCKAESQLT